MIVTFLKWALSRFETKPVVEAWPFPEETTRVRKTRDLPSKATIAKKALSKKVK